MSSAADSLERRIAERLRPSPRQNPAFQVRRFGDDTDQALRFYIYSDVLEELAFSAAYDDARICTALLIGGFGMEPEGGFVEVSGFHALQWVDSPDDLYGALRESTDEWIRTASQDALVGLFVATSGGEARVDPEIARVHFSLFNIPFQPLVVFDPRDEVLGVYARAPEEPFFEAAFRAVAANPSLNPDVASGTQAESEE